jgi:Host cell surface-exposed lipoprotein
VLSSILGGIGALLLISVIAGVATAGKTPTSSHTTNPPAAAASSSTTQAPANTTTQPAASQPTSAPAAAPSPAAPPPPQYTASQEQAIQAAQGYLSDGEGFSYQGLIDQLDSPDGDGFSQADATVAVNSLNVNWNQQAVESAQGYMSDGQGFSACGLVQQLDSPDGEQFTQAQAEYAVGQVGLGSC